MAAKFYHTHNAKSRERRRTVANWRWVVLKRDHAGERYQISGERSISDSRLILSGDRSILLIKEGGAKRATPQPRDKIPQKGRSPWPRPPSPARPLSSSLSPTSPRTSTPRCWARCSHSSTSRARRSWARLASSTRVWPSGRMRTPPRTPSPPRSWWPSVTPQSPRLRRRARCSRSRWRWASSPRPPRARRWLTPRWPRTKATG